MSRAVNQNEELGRQGTVGHRPAAAPPRSVMNSRRFNGSNCIDARQPEPIRKLSYWRGCVRWHESYFATRQPSESGPGHTRATSLAVVCPLPPDADMVSLRQAIRIEVIEHLGRGHRLCTSGGVEPGDCHGRFLAAS